MLNAAKDEASTLVTLVLDQVHALLSSRKFVLAVAGFVGVTLGVPTEAVVPLVAVILAEGAADYKSR